MPEIPVNALVATERIPRARNAVRHREHATEHIPRMRAQACARILELRSQAKRHGAKYRTRPSTARENAVALSRPVSSAAPDWTGDPSGCSNERTHRQLKT